MYDENSMKSHIFWIKARRVFLLLFLTAIGTAIGVVISDYVVNILLFNAFLRPVIIILSALIFLGIALLLTAHTGKEVEDGYWKIAVYKKLAIISKKLDNLEKLNNLENLNNLFSELGSSNSNADAEINTYNHNNSSENSALTHESSQNSSSSETPVLDNPEKQECKTENSENEVIDSNSNTK